MWNYLVVKMRFECPTCCICRGTFCIQISCSNNSAISPTENLSSSNNITPFLSILIPTFQLLSQLSLFDVICHYEEILNYKDL